MRVVIWGLKSLYLLQPDWEDTVNMCHGVCTQYCVYTVLDLTVYVHIVTGLVLLLYCDNWSRRALL